MALIENTPQLRLKEPNRSNLKGLESTAESFAWCMLSIIIHQLHKNIWKKRKKTTRNIRKQHNQRIKNKTINQKLYKQTNLTINTIKNFEKPKRKIGD